MRLVVDTGVFSASLSRRRRQRFETQIALMAGNQILLAAVTVSELRYGALVAGWAEARRERLEELTVAPRFATSPRQQRCSSSPPILARQSTHAGSGR